MCVCLVGEDKTTRIWKTQLAPGNGVMVTLTLHFLQDVPPEREDPPTVDGLLYAREPPTAQTARIPANPRQRREMTVLGRLRKAQSTQADRRPPTQTLAWSDIVFSGVAFERESAQIQVFPQFWKFVRRKR